MSYTSSSSESTTESTTEPITETQWLRKCKCSCNFLLECVPVPEQTAHICYAAVRNHPWNLKHVRKDLLTEKMCIAAVKRNPKILYWFREWDLMLWVSDAVCWNAAVSAMSVSFVFDASFPKNNRHEIADKIDEYVKEHSYTFLIHEGQVYKRICDYGSYEEAYVKTGWWFNRTN